MRTTHLIDAAIVKAEAEGRVTGPRLIPIGEDLTAVWLSAPRSVSFALPVPPSVNNLYRNRKEGGRARSAHYATWATQALAEVRRQKVQPPAPGPFKITVTVTGGVGFSKGRDIDNVLKPVVDLAKSARLIRNDNVTVVVEVTARYLGAVGGSPASCRVEIATIGEVV